MKLIIIPLYKIFLSVLYTLLWVTLAIIVDVCSIIWQFKLLNKDSVGILGLFQEYPYHYKMDAMYNYPTESIWYEESGPVYYKTLFHFIWNIKPYTK